jgi:hypothetical protein
MSIRYVRNNRYVSADSHCRLCGSNHGVVRPEVEHRATTCKLCGSRQCMGNGLGNGCCPICYYGHLEGWSQGFGVKKCGYKGCPNPPIARGIRGKTMVCREHLDQQQGPGFVGIRMLEREKNWTMVSESPNSPYA